MHKTSFPLAAALIAMALTAGCAPRGSDLAVLDDTSSLNNSYILGSGDKLEIVVYGTGDATNHAGGPGDGVGQYVVSETGTVDAPFIGTVTASGLTVDQLKQEITQKLAQGYINDPKVGLNVLAYRPFYIVGEVNHPGAYPCTAKSRVISAVATAGGYTYRAAEDFAIIERKQGDKVVTGRAGPDTQVLPDDVVRISERYY